MANEWITKAGTALDDYENTLRDRIDELNKYKDVQEAAIDVMENFPELEWSGAQFTLDTGTFKAFIITADCKTLSEIVEPLKFLREKLGTYKISDDPDIRRRCYKFDNDRLVFQAWFWGKDDDVCRYVQVGTKEVPVYQLKCAKGEEGDLENAENSAD